MGLFGGIGSALGSLANMATFGISGALGLTGGGGGTTGAGDSQMIANGLFLSDDKQKVEDAYMKAMAQTAAADYRIAPVLTGLPGAEQYQSYFEQASSDAQTAVDAGDTSDYAAAMAKYNTDRAQYNKDITQYNKDLVQYNKAAAATNTPNFPAGHPLNGLPEDQKQNLAYNDYYQRGYTKSTVRQPQKTHGLVETDKTGAPVAPIKPTEPTKPSAGDITTPNRSTIVAPTQGQSITQMQVNPNDYTSGVKQASGVNLTHAPLASRTTVSPRGTMADSAEVDFTKAFESINEAIVNTNNFMEVQDSYIQDWTKLFGSPGVNMNDYFQKYKPEQLEALGLSQIKEQFQTAADTAKAHLAQAGLSGSGIEAGVLNDVRISEAEALSSQRINNVNNYYDKLMNWNQFEATSKINMMGQQMAALGMENQLHSTYANLVSNEEQINAAYNQAVNMHNASTQLQINMQNAAYQQQANQTNTAIQNQRDLAQANLAQNMRQFNASQYNTLLSQGLRDKFQADAYNTQNYNNTVVQNNQLLNNANQYNNEINMNQGNILNQYGIDMAKFNVGVDMQKYGADMGVALQNMSNEQADKNGLMNILGTGLGLTGAALISDVRVKDNIHKIGTYGPLNIYEWDWKDNAKDIVGDTPNKGFIVQEVEQYYPEAIIEMPSGYKGIDYSMILEGDK